MTHGGAERKGKQLALNKETPPAAKPEALSVWTGAVQGAGGGIVLGSGGAGWAETKA